MTTALLLLEIQNDYFPNGRIPLEKSVEASAKAQAVLQAYREKQLPIIHVQHISTQPNATYFLPCTKGAEFYHAVQPIRGETIFKKHYHNSFKDTALRDHLIKHRINHLVICGMMTQYTIDSTVRAAADIGLSCTVLHDACAARALEYNHTVRTAEEVQTVFIAALQTSYATVLSAEEFLQKNSARTAVTA